MEPVGHPSTSPVVTIPPGQAAVPVIAGRGVAPAVLTFAVRLCSGIAAHEAGGAVRGGCGARRRAGSGGQALMRGCIVQGPVAGEGRRRRLVLIQAAPQAGGLQAERASGGGTWARVQRRAQPVQRATAAVGHLEEGQPLIQPPLLTPWSKPAPGELRFLGPRGWVPQV